MPEPSGNYYQPMVHSWSVGGKTETDKTMVAIVCLAETDASGSDLPRGMIGPMFGLLENFSNFDYVFRVKESNDNNAGDPPDPYAPAGGIVNAFRVDGTNVTTITVKPGGKVSFILEATQTKRFLRFETTAAGTYYGKFTLVHFGGTVIRRDHEGW